MADQENLLRLGIQALERGDLPEAQSLLKRFVLLAPTEVEGWWWLGQSLTDPARRADCFKRVLALQPGHRGAQAMLAALSVHPTRSPFETPSGNAGLPSVHPDSDRLRPLPGLTARFHLTKGTATGIVLGLAAGGLVIAVLGSSGGLDSAARALSRLISPPRNAGSPVPAIALPSTWTPTLTITFPPPTHTRTPSLPTGTPTIVVSGETYDQRLLLAKADIERAEALTADKKYAEALLAWDAVLRRVPDYGDGYYQRSRGEIELLANQRIQSEYRSLLDQAFQDINNAIIFSPVLTGDHYYTRFQILDWLAVEEPYYADRKQIWLVALENLTRSLALGNSFPYSERNLAFLYAALGEWRLGLADAQRLVRARGPSAPQSCDLNTSLSENYQVAGRFEEALRKIDVAISVCPTDRALGNRAWILYALGRLKEARAQVDEMIEKNPYYGGGRYYLRALISYDEGRLDEALSDLDFGEGQTWGRAGIYSYLRGRFALEDGDKMSAIELLQYAEASLGPVGTGPFIRRIERELASLGASPLTVTPQVLVPGTPMPTLIPTITPRPMPAGLAATPPGTRLVDMSTGTGPLLLRPDDFPSFHFQTSSRMKYDSVESLTIYLVTSSPIGIPTLQVSPWNPVDGGFGLVDNPVWGANPVRYPERYLTPGGDFFVSVHNWGEQTIQLDNLGVILIVRLKDGTRVTFGLGEN